MVFRNINTIDGYTSRDYIHFDFEFSKSNLILFINFPHYLLEIEFVTLI